MAATDIAGSRDRVATLRLMAPAAGAAAAAAGAAGAMWVAGGSLIAFGDSVSEQSRVDVLRSTLLSQLAANAQHDRQTEAGAWYQFYTGLLAQLGWNLQNFSFSRYETNQRTLTLDTVITGMFDSRDGRSQMDAVQALLRALTGLPDDDPRATLFERTATSAVGGNVQVVVVTEAAGAVTARMAALYYATSEIVRRLLDFTFSTKDTTFWTGVQEMTLTEGVYAQLRDAVTEKLGDRTTALLQPLPDGVAAP